MLCNAYSIIICNPNSAILTWLAIPFSSGYAEYIMRNAGLEETQAGITIAGRNISRKNEETEPKQKQHPVGDVTGDRSKVQCCKEQYCIGIWNVKSMNQGKFGSGQTRDGKREHQHSRYQ